MHAIKPRYLLWENVPGVLSTKDNAFGCFLAGLVGSDTPVIPEEDYPESKNWRTVRISIHRPFIDGEWVTLKWKEKRACRWTSAGVVSGPLGSCAWRVLDAQYFGLAQRRKRVFVVFCAGDGTDPAEILLEFESLSRHPPTRGEEGEGPTGTISARTRGGGGVGTDFELGGALQPCCFGGSNTSGPIEVATALNARGGVGRIDFESETFIALPISTSSGRRGYGVEENYVAHALRADGFDASEDGTRRGTPLVPWMPQGERIMSVEGIADTVTCNPNGGPKLNPVLAPVAFNNTGNGWWNDAESAATIRKGDQRGGGGARESTIVAIPILEAGARTGKSTDDPRAGIGIGEAGDPMFTLQSGKQHAIGFSCKDHGSDAGEIAPTLRSMGHDESHANGGGQVAVAFETRFVRNGRGAPDEVVPPLKAQSGQTGKGDAAPCVATAMAVRRLTPRECERLMGFSDDYTAISVDGRVAADGPRYKALGNSMAVPCLSWLGRRIQMVMEVSRGKGK
jgi:DNA (cytosine-5)-methyltransferase 1